MKCARRLVEDGRERAVHDASSGILTVWLPKETSGEHFDDLHMVSELLRVPSRQAVRRPLIEVVSSLENADEMDADAASSQDEDELNLGDVEVDQNIPSADELHSLSCTPGYGFNAAYSAIFRGLDEDGDLLMLRAADEITPVQRRVARLASEDADFEVEHYIADFCMPEECEAARVFSPWWFAPLEATSTGASTSTSASDPKPPDHGVGSTVWFNIGSELQQQLQQLPRREYLLDKAERRVALCGLVDLLFAYSYDVRTTEGEHTVESGWTIRRLSSQLSFLDTFSSLQDVVVACVRRSLCYPLRRHWGLALTVLEDVGCLLRLGREAVLRALLEVRGLVQAGVEHGYLLNRIWLDDYCVWVQQLPPGLLNRVAERLEHCRPSRAAVGWPLLAYEELADEDEDQDEKEASS